MKQADEQEIAEFDRLWSLAFRNTDCVMDGVAEGRHGLVFYPTEGYWLTEEQYGVLRGSSSCSHYYAAQVEIDAPPYASRGAEEAPVRVVRDAWSSYKSYSGIWSTGFECAVVGEGFGVLMSMNEYAIVSATESVAERLQSAYSFDRDRSLLSTDYERWGLNSGLGVLDPWLKAD